MARSFESCVKGMLRNAPTGRSSGSQDSSGCGGCLMTFAVIVGVALIIEFWIPLLVALAVALVGWVVYRMVLAFRQARDVGFATDDPGVTRSSVARDTSHVPAGWYPDPLGGHQHRYWDGSTWSDSVADDGVVTSQPL